MKGNIAKSCFLLGSPSRKNILRLVHFERKNEVLRVLSSTLFGFKAKSLVTKPGFVWAPLRSAVVLLEGLLGFWEGTKETFHLFNIG
jgi:hypothetical protein